MDNSERPVATFNNDLDSRFVDKRLANVKSDLIEITHDKLENTLLKHLSKVETRKSWLTPFSILLTVVIARSTSDFKDAFGIPKESWDAFFILICVSSVIWLMYSIFEIYKNWGQTSIEFLIELIKKGKIN